MDMNIEVEEFKKKNAPSLIGSSLRDSSDQIPTLKSFDSNSTKTSFFKSDSASDLVPVDEIAKEGGLITDQDGQELEDVLDKEGHVKKNLIPDAVMSDELKSQVPATSLTPAELKELNVEEEKIDDGNKETILGGDADKYLAPAGGTSSDYKYPLKKKKGTNLTQLDDSSTFIEPDKMRSVDDIINVVNKGDFEKASTLIDGNVAKSICPSIKSLSLEEVKEAEDPPVPDSAIEVDSEFTPPAAMREGSESRLLEEQRSRSLSRHGHSSSQSNAHGDMPNLARGESIHSGLNGDLSITSTYDKSSHSLVSERRPRHDPSGPRIPNSSSLNYLRSISRSRSRMANDRRALGEEQLDSNDLRESGALINDDSMSNRSDIEYAVNKALDFVEDTHSVKGGKRLSDGGDIVKNLQKGLAEVAEEEQASNRKTMKSSDLLDQLANSAMELMLDDEEEEGGKEEPANDEILSGVDGANEEERETASADSNTDEPASGRTIVEDKKDQEDQEMNGDERTSELSLKCGDRKEVKETEVKESSINVPSNIEEKTGSLEGNDSKVATAEDNELEKVETDDKMNAKLAEKEIEIPQHAEDEEKEKLLRSNVQEANTFSGANDSDAIKEDEGDTKAVEYSDDEKVENSEGQDPEEIGIEQKKIGSIEVEADGVEEPVELEVSGVADDHSKTSAETDIPLSVDVKEVGKEEQKDLRDETAEVATEADNEKLENNNSSSVDENTGVAVESSHTAAAESLPGDKKDVDDTDALIAAAMREKAMKESYNPLGKDGSVFVPKIEKMTFEDEPVYLYTSFAGGFQVTTRTNRLVTILTANRIKFEYRDLGTDEEAKKVWRRYSAAKTLPGIVRGKDDFIGNWQDIEEANEDYRVRSMIYETY
ncbi:hypothetical protein PMKS-004062 [Pichia membranifaciens]|uniref:Uncharacterized protein n=1 Tax=Pichia membranifaciens TaxID=4926 RepID=A0A1Q2YLX1_9ASCO|nr:hypothetical protein PMKS-004062 [Pichia membranifaciens]